MTAGTQYTQHTHKGNARTTYFQRQALRKIENRTHIEEIIYYDSDDDFSIIAITRYQRIAIPRTKAIEDYYRSI